MRRTALWKALVALLCLSLLAAACGDDDNKTTEGSGTASSSDDNGLPDTFPALETPTKGGRLQMAQQKPLDCYNGLSYYGISWALFYFMARGLYGYPNVNDLKEADTVRPDLAADLPEVSTDGLTYTVKLREGLKFPDGRPVTSADVKATYEYMLDPNIQCTTGGPPSSGYYNVIDGATEYNDALKANPAATTKISGITTPDELTTVFKLDRKDGAFLRDLAMGWSFIRPADTPHKKLDKPPLFVGPYTITDYVPDKSVTIDREDTWKDAVAAGVPEEDNENNVDGIDLKIGTTNTAQLSQLKKNELDLTYDYSAPVGTDIPAVAGDSAYKGRFFSVSDSALDYGVFRTDKEPFNNAKLRQAVNYGIDRVKAAKVLGGKLRSTPWSEMLSENLLVGSNDPHGTVYTFKPDTAKQLVEDSGVKTPIKVTLLYFTTDPSPALAAAVKEDLDAIGFNVTLKAANPDVYYGILQDKTNAPEMGFANWGQDYNDAITFFLPLLTCPGGVPTGSNYAFYCNKAFDDKVAEISQLPVGDDRAQQYADLSEQTAKTDAPWWPISNRRRVLLVSERVGNFYWVPIKQWYFASYYIKDAG